MTQDFVPSIEKSALSSYKEQVVEIFESIETGDRKPLAYISPNRYIQHNLALADGLAGVTTLWQSRPKGSVRVNPVRVFQDGDFVFAHTEYDLAILRVGFDIWRFEDGMIVEHWDNHQEKANKPSPSGHTMTDGPTTASDLDKTEANKALMRTYMDDLLNGRRFTGLQSLAKEGLAAKYDRVHRVLVEGNFVLVVAEGSFGELPSSYYDLYRIQNGKIAEHWDTIQPIPPRAEWKNSNGKF